MAAKNVEGAEVREWAREKGITVGSRGRLSAELIDQFRKAKRGRKVYVEPRQRVDVDA